MLKNVEDPWKFEDKPKRAEGLLAWIKAPEQRFLTLWMTLGSFFFMVLLPILGGILFSQSTPLRETWLDASLAVGCFGIGLASLVQAIRKENFIFFFYRQTGWPVVAGGIVGAISSWILAAFFLWQFLENISNLL